jgi:hypothetical protein
MRKTITSERVAVCDQLPGHGRAEHEIETGRAMRALLLIVLLCAVPVTGIAQTPVALDLNDKLHFHAASAFGPTAIAISGVKAGYHQLTDSPAEWGQGGSGYRKRLGSSVATSGIRNVLAFSLDSTLHQDPRYFRSVSTGFWRRTGRALRGTILTYTDSGGETLSTWRLGSAYGTALISNQWYPGRYHSVRRAMADGSIRLGFDFANNMAAEFWPDFKRKILRRRP